MSASELAFLSVREQARRVRAKELSARTLCEVYLQRIAELDSQLGAYLLVDHAGARAQAERIDAQVAAGGDPGALAGVPVALKDVLVTRGVETTAASKILAGWIPPYDATVVSKLREAGAVILGKLNCDEFAMGSSNENSSIGPCRNPWNRTRVAGGSSGGSAAAVAAGLCAASLGTDTGGSIRQPAAFCGVVGIKPTYGRISRYGVIAYASSFDQVGPITRNVDDAALLLEVLCGYDPCDATSIETAVPLSPGDVASVEGLRLGIPRELFSVNMDEQVRAAVMTAIDALEAAGACPVEVSLPHAEYALPAYYLLAPAEASSNLARFDGVRYGRRSGNGPDDLLDMYCRTRGEGFGPEVKRRIMLGTFALRSGYYDAYYAKAQKVRTLIKRDFDRVFEIVDAVLSPTTPSPAFGLGEKTKSPMEMYLADIFTLSCNLAGLPGMSVPCGFSDIGLPIGLQILGKTLDEATVLQVGAALERAVGATDRRPEVG